MEPLNLAAAAVFINAALWAGSRHVAKVLRYVEGRRFLASNNDSVASDERFVLIEESIDDAEIDIVLIHGLQNSRPSKRRPTEAQKDQTASWVRDNLPETEKVRILSYHYDTTLRTPEYLTRRTLFHEAVQLNTRLVHARANARSQDRPIIFVAHSLGGILLKNALVNSKMSGREDERSILISTAGCLFYDTPHEPLSSQLAESIWATVEPRLEPLQAESLSWQRSEFLCWASDLVHQTKRFDDIAANMRRTPQYIKLKSCGQKESSSLKDYVVLDTLKAWLRDFKKMDYGAGAVTKMRTGDMAAKAELTLGDGMQASNIIWFIAERRETQRVQPETVFMQSSPFIKVINDSERPQTLHALDLVQNFIQPGLIARCKSNFRIRASNQAFIAMRCLNRSRRGSIRHVVQQLDKVHRMSGTEEPKGLSGEKALPYHHLIVSPLVETINLWLERPKSNQFLLIIDSMPSMDSHSRPTTSTTEQTSNYELKLPSRSTLLMFGLTDNMCHVIYTIECHETKHIHSIATREGCGSSSDIDAKSIFSRTWDTPPWDYCHNIVMSRGESRAEGLGVVETCPLFLRLFISNERNRGAIGQNWIMFVKTEDLTDSVCSIDERLRHLEIKGISDRAPEPFSDLLDKTKNDGAQYCPELHILMGERFRHPSVASTLKCRERATASRRNSIAKLDFKTSLVDGCLATVQSCSDMQELLIAPESNFVEPGYLCELSAYLKHSTLVGKDHQRNMVRLLCICSSRSEGFNVELISLVAREVLLGSDTKKAEYKFRGIMRLAEGIDDVQNTVTLEVFRLVVALLALEGYKGEPTTTLENLLLSLEKNSRNESAQDHSTSKDKLFELLCLDCIYLARRGYYEMAEFLLQCVLATQQLQDKSARSSFLDLLDSIISSGNHFGEQQFSNSHYWEAKELVHHWLRDLHLSASALGIIGDPPGNAGSCLGDNHPLVAQLHEYALFLLSTDTRYGTPCDELVALWKRTKKVLLNFDMIMSSQAFGITRL